MALTYNRPPVLVREFLITGTMYGMPLAELYRVYAAALGQPALTATERMQAVFDWIIAMTGDPNWDEFDQLKDSASEDIEAVDLEVQELVQDIEDAPDTAKAGADEVQEAFDEAYGD